MQPLICGSESGRLVEDWWKIGSWWLATCKNDLRSDNFNTFQLTERNNYFKGGETHSQFQQCQIHYLITRSEDTDQ